MKRLYIGAILLIAGCFGHAYASISLSGTRLIYNQADGEASINVTNNGEQDVLIQSWLEGGEINTIPPFAMTPPLAKIAAKQRQILRIFYQGEGLPQDRESVFWLNVQEIPQMSTEENVVQLAVLQRIKLFYRPSGLEGKASEAPLNLKVNIHHGQLEIQNPTPYHVNLTAARQGGNQVKLKMIPPYQSVHVDAPGFEMAGELVFQVVSDYGAVQTVKGSIASDGLQNLEYVKLS